MGNLLGVTSLWEDEWTLSNQQRTMCNHSNKINAAYEKGKTDHWDFKLSFVTTVLTGFCFYIRITCYSVLL